MKNIKRVLLGCVILLACVTAPALPALASAGSTTVSTTVVSGMVPLVAYNVHVSPITGSTANISWQTYGNSNSSVFYDITSHMSTAGYANSTSINNSVSNHNVLLTGLSPNTTYHYRVKSVDMINNTAFTAISADYTFHTAPPQAIKVTANPQKKVYGTGDPPLTYTSNSTVATFTGALSRAPGENVGTYSVNQGSLSAGSNYIITFVPAKFTIVKANTTTTIISPANPGCLLYTFYFGQVTFSATVAAVAPSVGKPTGTVTFYDGTTKLGTGTISSSGKATCSTCAMTVFFSSIFCNHSITAVYNGDTNFNGSKSLALIQKHH
jgi:hypothetical protein